MSKLAENSKLVTLLAFLAIYIIWGSTYLAIKYAIDTVPPLMMAGARFILAGTSLYIFMRLRGEARPSLQQLGQAAIVGTLLLALGNGGVVLAEKSVPTGMCALLVAMVPVYIALLEHINKGLPSPRTSIGLVLGTVGIFTLVGPGAIMGNGGVSWFGVGALVLSSLSWSVGSVYARRAALPNSPIVSTALQMISGGLILSLVSFGLGESQKFDVSRISFSLIASFAYLVIFGSIVAFSAFSWLLKHQTASKVSTYAYVNPIVAVFLGWALLGEKVSMQIVYSGAIILVAVWLITAPAKRKLVLEPISVESNDGLEQRLIREAVASTLDR